MRRPITTRKPLLLELRLAIQAIPPQIKRTPDVGLYVVQTFISLSLWVKKVKIRVNKLQIKKMIDCNPLINQLAPRRTIAT